MKKHASHLRRILAARRDPRGFTLIEVMIVVAIIGVLAAIAVPSYNDYVRRGTLPEAFNALSDFRSKMEQYYQDNRNYGTAAACAPDTTEGWKDFAATKNFSFSCTASGASFQSYTITATGTGHAVTGHVYTIDHEGTRKTTKFKNADVDQECWLTSSTTC